VVPGLPAWAKLFCSYGTGMRWEWLAGKSVRDAIGRGAFIDNSKGMDEGTTVTGRSRSDRGSEGFCGRSARLVKRSASVAVTANLPSFRGEAKAVNGLYRFDSTSIWMAGTFAAIGFVMGLVITATASQSPAPVLVLCTGIILSVAAIASLFHFFKLSGRVLQLSNDGISIRGRSGNEIGSIRWSELGNVTERRKMVQLALWDRTGARRVLVDGQYENFDLIRSRILDEYARTWTPKTLPMEFRSTKLFCAEAVVIGAGAVLMSWGGWSSWRQEQLATSIGLFCFAAFCVVGCLNLYPQLRGPSVLFEDRLVLRSLFRTREIYRRDVSSVRIGDLRGYSILTLQTMAGNQILINARYGSIPDIYLNLKAWLAEK